METSKNRDYTEKVMDEAADDVTFIERENGFRRPIVYAERPDGKRHIVDRNMYSGIYDPNLDHVLEA